MSEEGVYGEVRVKTVDGVVQCDHCSYWGAMKGYIEPDNLGIILFKCPECDTFEKVKSPF